MDRGGVFVIGFLVVLQLGMWVSANVVFQVQHKFTGNESSLTAYKAHDSYRHRRILSATQLPIGGNGGPTSSGLYFTKIQIGSPPKDYRVQVDTGSDLLWVNCVGCANCPTKSDLGISLTFYDPLSSSSSRMVTCDQDFCTSALDPSNNDCIIGTQCLYRIGYGDGSSTTGYYVRDRVQLDKVSGNLQTASINGSIIFGCGAKQSGELGSSDHALDGILGLGPGNSSIISQLALAKKVKKTFSHCLASSKGGGIFAIGEVVQPKVNTTPIIPDEAHFNVELKAIEVGGDFLQLPTDVFDIGSNRGAIIDSGSTLAYFPNEVYHQIMEKIMATQPNTKSHTLDGEFKCYKYLGIVDDGFPIITFHFANSLRLKIYPHQYLFQVQDQNWCIGFLNNAEQPNYGKDMILLGDLVLSDKLVTYNMEDQTIGWIEYDCSSSIKVKDEETGMVYEVDAHNILSSSSRICSRVLGWVVFIMATTMVMY